MFADVAGYKSVSVEKPVPHRCSEEVMVGVGVTVSALWTNIAAAAAAAAAADDDDDDDDVASYRS